MTDVQASAPRRHEPNRVRVTWKGEERFEGGRDGRPASLIDGSGVSGPSPVDQLLNALGACAAVDVVEILAKRRTPVESLEVEVTGKRVETIPRHLEHVTLRFIIRGAGIERIHAERAIDLSINKYCSVRSSLRPDVPVEWELDLGD